MMVTFVAIAVIGLFIGLFSGLLGVGGGSIAVPVFRLVFGMGPVASTATSLFTIIPTSVSGAVTHVRAKTCAPKLGLALGVGGACTSPLGAWLANSSPGWLVMVASAAVIGYSAFTMLRKAVRMGSDAKAGENPRGIDAPSGGGFSIPSFSRVGLLKGFGIGLVTGLASGFVGLGGGFIMVPLMMSVLDFPMRLSSGTSLIAVMLLAIPGVIMQSMLGNVDYLAGIALSCGSIPGALIGARLVTRVPERALRFTFAGFLGVGAILLVVRECIWPV